MKSQLFRINYVVGAAKESVTTEANQESIDDIVYLMCKVYKCKNVWYTNVDDATNVRTPKQTLNYVYGSLVSQGLAGVIG